MEEMVSTQSVQKYYKQKRLEISQLQNWRNSVVMSCCCCMPVAEVGNSSVIDERESRLLKPLISNGNENATLGIIACKYEMWSVDTLYAKVCNNSSNRSKTHFNSHCMTWQHTIFSARGIHVGLIESFVGYMLLFIIRKSLRCLILNWRHNSGLVQRALSWEKLTNMSRWQSGCSSLLCSLNDSAWETLLWSLRTIIWFLNSFRIWHY
jgi:hypothetical protein